jgi:hypothetical protein
MAFQHLHMASILGTVYPPDHLNVGLGYAVLHYSALFQSRVIKFLHNRLKIPMNPKKIFETLFCEHTFNMEETRVFLFSVED